MRDDLPYFTGHILPVLVAAACPCRVDVARLGQIVADAATVADVPMAADVVLLPEGCGVQPHFAACVPQGGVRAIRQVVSFAVALHVEPSITFGQSADLTVIAYQSIAVQVDAAHAVAISVIALPRVPQMMA